MRCDKCSKDFPENLLHYSHDIPKWLGGDDGNGRHLLCKDCHDEYENEGAYESDEDAEMHTNCGCEK